ncbi:MAG: aminomethyl-transferring glycine dehydrogenase [Verrucomicrobiota bacterium]
MTYSDHPDTFEQRHLGPRSSDHSKMLQSLGVETLDSLIDQIVPENIRIDLPLSNLAAASEMESMQELRELSEQNQVKRSLIGMGYYASILPPVIQRNILENPGWYTAYTPYQAEISQGRMEALLNYQTLVTDLTGMDIANASLLDEATAAAEAVGLCYSLNRDKSKKAVAVFADCHPQTRHVVRTRAEALGIEVREITSDEEALKDDVFAVLVQYPNTFGEVNDYSSLSQKLKANKAFLIVAADLLSLSVLVPPGEFGADVVVGSTQRFGLPMGWGGPHAAYFATHDAHKRQMPGRLIGVSKDASGNPALRLSLQTREQHIRREKATSNICTAQVLPAVLASMYAVYHGKEGLQGICKRIVELTAVLGASLEASGLAIRQGSSFDTVVVECDAEKAKSILTKAVEAGYNFRELEGGFAVSLDEKTAPEEVASLAEVISGSKDLVDVVEPLSDLPIRNDEILSHPVFSLYRSETEMMRYMKRLENRDISLTHSMIPLGSCTMKLNAAAEMMPLSWPGFSNMHPYAPEDQCRGYLKLCDDLEKWLSELTGFEAISLQPNAGSQGEYAGLLAIKKYQESIGQGGRDVCLVPQSAHGTNFASAAMIGYQVVIVKCDESGNVDVDDLNEKAKLHVDRLAAAMVTYPSTHGVFETRIQEICACVHDHGGQVYMDGANMNAQVGLTSPAAIGADVCHLNLHKTFCIPHGGGGPGMGPIGVAKHLAPFLPSDPISEFDLGKTGAVSASNYGSGCILTISWAYIRMMGGSGLREASRVAMLNANYIAQRLDEYFPVLYKGDQGNVAHECILDLREWKKSAGIEVEDVAKRLIDYGFHAPTMSWPVPGTLMIEPTESEALAEMDRFCEAMIKIHGEILKVVSGDWPMEDNPLKNAPHTAEDLLGDWEHAYSREEAVFPIEALKHAKYWPPVKRVDNVYGDRNLFCSCVMPDEVVAKA